MYQLLLLHCIHASLDYNFVFPKALKCLSMTLKQHNTINCETGFGHGYEIIITVLFRSLKTFFNKARDMLYFKRLIQIPKLPDVREPGVGTH